MYRNTSGLQSVGECEKAYVQLLATNGISNKGDNSLYEEITGTIDVISQVVIEGNTHYYITLKNSEAIFDINVSDANLIDIIRYKAGDLIKLSYTASEQGLNVVSKLE